MTRIIPEQRVFICDRCRQENPDRQNLGVLKLRHDPVYWDGSRYLPVEKSYELCDPCYRDLETVVAGFMANKETK